MTVQRRTRSWARWTKNENKILHEIYESASRAEIESRLSRHSWGAILSRATIRYGLHRYAIWKVREFSEIEAAWLAAAIDGEGYLRFSFFLKNGRQKWVGRLDVSNTNKEFCNRVKEIVGYGHVQMVDFRNYTPLARYTLASLASIGRVLEQIEPYLIIKREKAKIMIEAGRLIQEHNRLRQPHDKRLKELLKEFDEIRYSKGIARKRAEANLPASGLEGWRTS